MPKFGDQRLVRPDITSAHRMLFRAMGVPDPAHYLHYRYLTNALGQLRDLKPKQILDAGCGAGDYSFHLARLFPDSEVLGIDINESLIDRNAETAKRLRIDNVRFEKVDLTKLSFENYFDLIVSIDVLEHVDPQAVAFANLTRAVKPGGGVYYHIPTIREVPVPFSSRLHGFHEWAEEEHIADDLTCKEVVEAVKRSGLEVISVTPTFGWFTGEMATSLFALPFADSLSNRIAQALLAPVCRVLALADQLNLDATRYAVGVVARRRPSK